jgi:transcriptional regulator with XRE-family HTH domain
LNLNQVIALNMARWRKAAGLKQDELGERLGWTNTTVSAAERSQDGKRVRQFTAAEVARAAEALGVPLMAMFLPPAGEKDEHMAALFRRILPDSMGDSAAMDAYREALAGAARDYLDPGTDMGLIAHLSDMTDKAARVGRTAQLVIDLRDFEREYRRRLRASLRQQLAELGPEEED